MKRIILYSALLLGLLPFLAHAHGDKYLEFNPDKSSSLKVIDGAVPSQVFFAQSDFLGSFDVWLANPGSSGQATFTFLNNQGIVLTSRTVTIPTIVLTSNGTRFHVDFNSQLPVLASEKYSIRITSSMPELRLYYSDRVQVISHNAPFVSPYITGVALLGSEEQYFSFKYALYETNEASAPIISNLGWSVISEVQMKISFNANEAIDYKIEYGLSSQGYNQNTNFLGDYKFCTQGISVCDLVIGVSSDSSYQYRLTVKDAWGNQSQITGTFTSGQAQAPLPTPTPINQPPIISNLRIADVTANSVGIAWTTNEITNSDILIIFSGFISVTAKSDPIFELEHYLSTDPVLSPGTIYTARVTSRDLDNNSVQASVSFMTLSNPTPIPTPFQSPIPSSPPPPTNSPSTSPAQSSLPPALNQPQTSPSLGIQTSSSPPGDGINTGTVQWGSSPKGEPSDGYRVDVFDQNGKLVKTVFVPSGSNIAEIPGLADGEYKVIVYANDGWVFKKIDKPASLKTGGGSFVQRLISFWWALIPLLAGLGYILWKNLKKKKPSQTVSQVVP